MIALLLVLVAGIAAQIESDFESTCVTGSCYPRWGNLLKGRRVHANSTCGENGPEEYCLISNDKKDIQCDECDSNNIYKKHPANYMKDRRIKSRTTWWKAENSVNQVTLQLDLETTFQFTHLILVFFSFRPAAMVIERSSDYANSWQPYQYFAYDCQKMFGMRERELGEPDEYGVKRDPDSDVICTSKYSHIEPANGGEVIYKVIRGRPTTNANRPSLRKLLLLTNLRVRFVKLHTLGDGLLNPNDLEAQKKYFYAVEDWVVRGSCFCNGHADTCKPFPDLGVGSGSSVKNMNHGLCECQHNTAGDNCQRCMDFHHKTAWMPGDPTTGAAHPCQECSCNGHTTKCEFDEQLFVNSGDGGRCLECKDSTAGARCDDCVYGYYQQPGLTLADPSICQPCNCNEAGTTSDICASTDQQGVSAGTCICKSNVMKSAKCDTCKKDHYNMDASNPLGCTACGCDTRGTVNKNTQCNEVTGQCECKEGATGLACDRCKVGFFNLQSASYMGCEECNCKGFGVKLEDKCDPLTGACFCKTGFTDRWSIKEKVLFSFGNSYFYNCSDPENESDVLRGFIGFSCDTLEDGYFIPAMDHWKYSPGEQGDVDGGYSEKANGTGGSGYTILPVDGSAKQLTDNTKEGLDNLESTLPTGFYDLKIVHEPAESDYTLELELEHKGKFDGTEPQTYYCNQTYSQLPFKKQTFAVTIAAGSSMTLLKDLCVEQGSQYNVHLALGNDGTGALTIQDIRLILPEEPAKAFPFNYYIRQQYEEYQKAGCPMFEQPGLVVDNECYRIKAIIEQQLQDKNMEACTVKLCLPDIDVWNFTMNRDQTHTEQGAYLKAEEGGTVRLPADSKMTVPLDPGTGGIKEVFIILKPSPTVWRVQVEINHIGYKDGSGEAALFHCNNKIVRPYSKTSLNLLIPANTAQLSIGEMCLDPNGDYLVSIIPTVEGTTRETNPALRVKEVVVALPDSGEKAFPNNKALQDLWDQYIAKKCPKIAGGSNSNKRACIDLINKINGLVSPDGADLKKDCFKDLCIPYNEIWSPSDPVDNLGGGSYINPTDNSLVIPKTGAEVELSLDGDQSVTQGSTDFYLKHAKLDSDQKVFVEIHRVGSEEPYSCGGIESVPAIQKISVTLLADTRNTLVSMFCMEPESKYTIRIVGERITQPVVIQEIASVLPSDPSAAYPTLPAVTELYKEYNQEGCQVYINDSSTDQCKHIANKIDAIMNPNRGDAKDCSIVLCYPQEDVFKAGDQDVTLETGALVEPSTGSMVMSAGGKVTMTLKPVITGNTTDKDIVKHDGILRQLQPGDGVLADKGFIMEDLIPEGTNTVIVEYDNSNPAYLPSYIMVSLQYKGNTDGSKTESFMCDGLTVDPLNTITRTLPLDLLKPLALFNKCLTSRGEYSVSFELEKSPSDRSLTVNRVYVELPKDSSLVFPDNASAQDTLQFLIDSCEVVTAECIKASRELEKAIEEANNEYKEDCSKTLCLPENNIWQKGDEFEGQGTTKTEAGAAVMLQGQSDMLFEFDGSQAPNKGLNSMIITINPADALRVLNIQFTPVKDSNPNPKAAVMCGDINSQRQQNVRKVIQIGVGFVEVSPVCLDPNTKYNVRIVYKGVQSPDGKLYTETSGLNIVINSVDLSLSTKSKEAFPGDTQAAEMWDKYVQAQCPRLRAGFRDATEECLALLADLQQYKDARTAGVQECSSTVCIVNEGGWVHDPTSTLEQYQEGAEIKGGAQDALIVIPPGGIVSIKTGHKEVAVPAENIPRTGLMDILITHKAAKRMYLLEVEVKHEKTKGDIIPAPYTCGDVVIQPFTNQIFEISVAPCTTETRIPSVCVSKDATYSITTYVVGAEKPDESCDVLESEDNGFGLDQVMFAFPEDPRVAFPDSEELQAIYTEFRANECDGKRNALCDQLTMDIIAELMGESVGCGCDPQGSKSYKCDSVGGQCDCYEGFTGRMCEMCKVGYYPVETETGSTTCAACNCNTYGSQSPICDVNGQCPCHPGVSTESTLPGMRDCSECLPGYVGLANLDMEGCMKCTCGEGARSSNCDDSSGTCSCLPGVAQPFCTNCSTGFYNLNQYGCELCQCDRAGSASKSCHQVSGQCECKENAYGEKCSQCKPGAFSMSEDNPSGCISCHCNGVTKECSKAKGYSLRSGELDLDWKVLDGEMEKKKNQIIGRISGTVFTWSSVGLSNYYASYSLDLSVELEGAESDVVIALHRGDVVISSKMQQKKKTYTTKLYQQNFETSSSSSVTKDLLMYILSNITRVDIASLYNDDALHDQKLKKFTIQTISKSSGKESAGHVEQCACPEGYSGSSCQTCSNGYTKSYSPGPDRAMIYTCVPCNKKCNGKSDVCDPETGVCENCADFTGGNSCEKCEEGYYPPNANSSDVCLPCPCTKNAVSPSCSIESSGDLNFPVCDSCQNGYTGPDCNDCAPGYFGKKGKCTACQCSGNIDLSDSESCNKKDGFCQKCLYNTDGDECEKCKDGFYGNAKNTELPKCESCRCGVKGSKSSVCDNISGLCDCLPNVSGQRCDQCTSGHWNITALYGCESCGCDPRGSMTQECNEMTGQCNCHTGIKGRKCDQCKDGFYNTNMNITEPFECSECQCNMEGSLSNQCDRSGQCPCKDSVVGQQCERCARGTTGVFPDCIPCGECYNQWEDKVEEIERQIEELAAKAKNIHLGAANLTESALEEMFKDMRKALREADKLTKESLGSEDDIDEMRKLLDEMNKSLLEKNNELTKLEKALKDVDSQTEDANISLDKLEQDLEKFRNATNSLSEKAKNLSAANLDEALKLVKEAANTSLTAKQAAQGSKAIIQDAEEKQSKAEKVLKDPVFRDTNTLDTINKIDRELKELESKLDVLDSRVCGSTSPDCDECGGSRCGNCGGDGCSGAVGIIKSITTLAKEARQCADDRQREVADATSDLREQSKQIDSAKETFDKAGEVTSGMQNALKDNKEKLENLKDEMEKFLESEKTTAADIQKVISATNDLSLPISDNELDTLIDDLSLALNQINLDGADLDVVLPDKERVEALLARAMAASQTANSTLESILNATAALRQFDEHFNAAQEILAETSQIANQGWNGINMITSNNSAAEKAREGLDEELTTLEQELQLLLKEIEGADSLANRASTEIDGADETTQANNALNDKLKKNYDSLNGEISKKETKINAQSAESLLREEKSRQIEENIDNKMKDVAALTERYISQQAILVDLNSEVDVMEGDLDDLISQIETKSVHHANCNNQIPS